MSEEWRIIPDFPKHGVSNLGRIKNRGTDHILKPTQNQQGVRKVNLSKEGKSYTRSVNVLVAQSFLPPPPRRDFISAIHLDGDKANCQADNLLWRPRYFAIRYHQQFAHPLFETSTVPVLDSKTGVKYESAQEAAQKHGLIFTEILVSAHNRTYVWPTYQMFHVITE